MVGISLAGILFFPLSLLLRSSALLATLAGLIVAGVVGVVRRFFAKKPPSVPGKSPGGWPFDLWGTLLLSLIVILVGQFIAEDLTWSYAWDGYQIWATKALGIYHDGALEKTLINRNDLGIRRILDYPPIVPLYEALVCKLRGTFEWNAAKPVFIFFFISMLASTYQAARSFASRPVALAAVVLLALLPAVSTHESVGGYADMPQGALMAAVLAVLFTKAARSGPGWRQPAPWIIGGLMFVKSEGTLLAVAVCGAVLVFILWSAFESEGTWRSGGGKTAQWARSHAAEIAVVLGCFAVRRLSSFWLGAHDLTYGPLDRAHLIHAYQNAVLVPKLCLGYMLRTSEWAWFWPAVLMSMVFLLVLGALRERMFVIGFAGALGAYTSIFYFTNWGIPLHIDQAYDRLLSQIAPAGAVLLAAAYVRLAGVNGSSQKRRSAHEAPSLHP